MGSSALHGSVLPFGKRFGLALIVFSAIYQSVAQVVIDDFNKQQSLITQNTVGNSSSAVPGSMLGGERDEKVTITSGSAIAAEIKNGAYHFSQGAGAAGNAEIVWDGTDGNGATIATTGLGALNLTAGSQNAFLLGVLSASQSVNATLTIYSSGGTTKSFTFDIPAGTTPNYITLAHSLFTGTGVFTSVGAIQLVINSNPGATLVLDFLRTSSTASPPLVEATMTDIVLVDNDGNGKASAGDTLRYIVRLKNNDSVEKTGVVFSAPVPDNTSLGTITVSPLARADGPASNTSAPGAPFHGMFNTPFTSGPPGLLANDFVGSPAAAVAFFGVTSYGATSVGETVTAHPAGTSAAFGGNLLTVNADGSLSLTPSSTFTGLILFQYRITNSAGISDASATIAIGARPDALDDAYSALGNVQITHAAGNGVLQKSPADSGDAAVVTTFGPTLLGVATHNAGTAGSTVNNGNLTLNADGSFAYNPPPGFTGTDTFVYRIDNGFNQPDTATVTITVSGLVWFIDNTAASGDGRITTPFNSIAAYNGPVPSKDAGDIIFIYQGSGSYGGAIALVNNQQLIGQGVDLASVASLNPPAGSIALPGVTGNPTLANAGTIVTLPGGSGASTIRGLTLNPSSGFAIFGDGSGAATVANNSINPSGAGGGISLTMQNGTFTLTSSPIAASGSSGALVLSGGSGNVTFDNSAISQAGAARLLDIQNRSGGTITLPGNLTANGSSFGIIIANSGSGSTTINLGSGTKVISTAGNTALTFSGNSSGTSLTSSGGLDVDSTSAAAVSITGPGSVTLNGSGNSINSTTGTAFVNSGTGGSATIDINATITSTTGRLIDIQNRAQANNLTLSGNLTNNGTGIFANNNTAAGTITFSGTAKTLNTGASGAVNLTGNTAATINFTNGGLDIDTTSGTGLNATGGGTISVQGSGNSIVATTGVGLNVSSTTIGAGGLTFEKISSGTGGNVGISLSNTGANGGLTVTGLDGVDPGSAPDAASGGTIANKSGSDGSTTSGIGIYLNNTRNVSLSGMQLNGFSNAAIRGSSVVGFTLADSVISGTSGDNPAVDDAPVAFDELTGTASIARTSIQGAIEDTFRVVNTSGTLNRIVFDTVTFGTMDTALGDNGLFLQARNNSILNATVQNCSFTSARGDQMQLDLTDTADGDLIFQNNQVTNTHSAVVVGGGGMTLSGGGSSGSSVSLTYNISGNTFRGARGAALLILMQTGAGSASGQIANNTFGSSLVDKSSSTEASAIDVRTAGRGAQTVSITGNTIRQYSNYGILLQMGDQNVGGSSGTIGALNATVSNNLVEQPSSFSFTSKNGIHVNLGTQSVDTHQACVHLQNNTAHASGSTDTSIGTDFVLRQRQLTTLRLPGYSGANNDNAAVVAFIQGQNIGTETVFASNTVSAGGGGFTGGAACLQP